MARLTLDPTTVAVVWLGGEPRERRMRDDAGRDTGPKLDDQGRQTFKLPAVLVVNGEAMPTASVATAELPSEGMAVGTMLRVAKVDAVPYAGRDGRVAVSAMVSGLAPLVETRASRQAAD